MTIYYVRKTGSNGAAGTSPATAWQTIDKATSTAQAGDTVYVGAGIYREVATLDYSGSSGSPIKFIADVLGDQTGDGGLVIVSAYTDAFRAADTTSVYSCIYGGSNQRQFVEFYDFVFEGGQTACFQWNASDNGSGEGVVLDGCAFIAHSPSGLGVYIDFRDAVTPTGSGLIIRNCLFYGGGIKILAGDSLFGETNLKAVIENNIFLDFTGSVAAVFFDITSTGTYAPGGIKIRNNTIIGQHYGVQVDIGSSITYPVEVYNNLIRALYAISKTSSNDGSVVSDYNLGTGTITNVTLGRNDEFASLSSESLSLGAIGGIIDWPLRRKLGWTPLNLFEPAVLGDSQISPAVGYASSSQTPDLDTYGLPRPAGRRKIQLHHYQFDASDAGPTDTNNVWTDEANIFDSDDLYDNPSTYGTCATVGNQSSNRVSCEGTNAPESGDTILAVEACLVWGSNAGASTTASVIIREESVGGAHLGLISPSASTSSLMYSGSTSSPTNVSWLALSVPSGGWTWAKVAALFCLLYKGDSDADVVRVYGVMIRVHTTTTLAPADSVGAVQTRSRLAPETTTKRTGDTAGRLEGAGRHQLMIPVNAASTTVSVYARKDSNYTGTAPQLKVSRIPGVADQTDTHTAAADTWEELTVTFTPTAAGVAVVELISNDTSATGKCFFDDLTVT